MENARARPLTSRTRVSLAIARGLAAARGDRDLTETHVASGIFREGKSMAIAAMWYAGMSESVIRGLPAQLEHSLGKPPGGMPPRLVAIDSSPGEEAILKLGDVEAAAFGDSHLGDEHILLAILRANGPVAQQIAQHGVTLQKYYDGLLAVRRGDPPPITTTH